MSKITILGVDVEYSVPSNLAELLSVPGASEEVIYKLALKQTLYHGVFGAIRSSVTALLEGTLVKEGEVKYTSEDHPLIGSAKRRYLLDSKPVELEYGEDKKVTGGKFLANGKALSATQLDEVDLETDANFVKRVLAEKSLQAVDIKPLLEIAIIKTPFAIVKTRQTGGVKKVAAAYISVATKIVDNNAAQGAANQLGDELEKVIEVDGLTRDEQIDVLARAIAESEAKQRKLRQQQLNALTVAATAG